MELLGESLAVPQETMSLIEVVSSRSVIAACHFQLYTPGLPKPVFCSANQCATNSVSPISLVDDHASYAPEIARRVEER